MHLPNTELTRLHQGEMEFILERFERSADSFSEPRKGMRLVSDNGNTVLDNQDYYPQEVDPEYQRRILACLRYCHRMPTVDLEKQASLLGIR